MRKIASVMWVLGAGMFATSAAAQQPAVDQYGVTPPAGTISVQATVEGASVVTPGSPSNGPSGSSGPGTAPTGAGASGGKPGSAGNKPGSANGGSPTGRSAGAAPASADDANRVALVQFGSTPAKLRKDIRAALTAAGLQVKFSGTARKQRLNAFLASPLAKLFSVAGDEAIGQAFGAQLVNVTPAARQAFPAIFGRKTVFTPVVRAVLTRRAGLGKKLIDFQNGVAKGLLSAGVPLAYVERSNTKHSHVDEFQKMGILTVADIDTLAGKQRLGGIMLGAITTQQAVDAVKVKPASQLVGSAGNSAGAAPWVILAILGGAAMFFLTGTLRRRGRGVA